MPIKCNCHKETTPIQIGSICTDCGLIYNNFGEVWFKVNKDRAKDILNRHKIGG